MSLEVSSVRCARCGYNNPDGVAVCQHCRAGLVPVPNASQPQPEAEAPVAAAPRRRANRLFVGLVVVMVMLGLGYLYAVGGFIHDLRQRLVTIQAQQHIIGGSPVEAIPRLRQALRNDPNNAELHYLLAQALDYEKRYAEALTEYQQAVRLAPKNDSYLVDLGVCQYRLGDMQSSKATYEKALEINPANWVAHDNLGFDYYDLGDTKKAVGHWQKGVQLKGDLADLWAGLAIGRLAQGDEPGAVQAYQKAVNLDPNYLDPQWMKMQALWSDKALAAAQKLMPQVQTPAPGKPAPPTEPTLRI